MTEVNGIRTVGAKSKGHEQGWQRTATEGGEALRESVALPALDFSNV
jgi:hypothetical protein